MEAPRRPSSLPSESDSDSDSDSGLAYSSCPSSALRWKRSIRHARKDKGGETRRHSLDKDHLVFVHLLLIPRQRPDAPLNIHQSLSQPTTHTITCLTTAARSLTWLPWRLALSALAFLLASLKLIALCLSRSASACSRPSALMPPAVGVVVTARAVAEDAAGAGNCL